MAKESLKVAWARMERERKASLLADGASPLAAAIRMVDKAVRGDAAFKRYARDQARAELADLIEQWARLIRNDGKPWHDKRLRIKTERCSVTMFDAKVSLHRDGRKRGIWFWFDDGARQALGQDVHNHVSEAALLEWPAAKRMLDAYAKEMRKAARTVPPEQLPASMRPRRRKRRRR